MVEIARTTQLLTKEQEVSMGLLTTMWIRAVRQISKGQTMTEYALIVATLAIVVVATYQVMGQDITTLVNKIDNVMSAS